MLINFRKNECIEENVLADFLRKHRGDVMGNCLTEFNEEAYKKGLLEEGRELEAFENAKMFFQNRNKNSYEQNLLVAIF